MLRMFASIALVAVAASAQAEKATLKVGADAPPLAIAKWVKGDAVTLEKGKIYVVEFWATWCGPCIRGMPHLSELQEQYKGKVTFVGVTKEDPNNALDAVEKMVQEKGPGMGYTVAWDDAGKTYAAYMDASGQRGIPRSFVVDGNGKIAYIGHPVTLDFVLSRVAAGTWNAEKGVAELGAAFKRGQELFDMDRTMTLQALPAFEKEHPDVAIAFESAKFQLFLLSRKTEAATALGAKMMEKGVKYNSPNLLNEVAWTIVDPELDVPNRDLDLAMKAAEKAVELSKGDAAIIDTLARVYHWRGDLEKAIELQTKAVEKAQGGDPDNLISLQETLDQYKAETAAKKE